MKSAHVMRNETTSSLLAIKGMGYKQAISLAFTKACLSSNIKGEMDRHVKLSKTFLNDARSVEFSPVLHSRYLMLSSYHRGIAHKIYWFGLRNSSFQKNSSFLQEA